MMKKILILTMNDLKNIIREPMLIFILVGPLLLSFGMHWFLPAVSAYAAPYFDLSRYYSLIVAFILLMTSMLMGMITGFLLLDERDDQVYMTLIVTPLGTEGYMMYRIAFPVIISFLYALITLPLVGLMKISFAPLLPIAIMSGLEAPIIALFLAGFAANKVEGLALSKGLGLFMIPPIAAYFIQSNWRLLAGVSPFYWPVHAFLAIGNSSGTYWIHILVGIFVHGWLLYGLVHLFKKRMR
ncbi:fluoroquinolone transport system permease protein [Anaerosolibacter carboniphilus]|uniref:Fluoroquinolone transport system permease protein n=1 Tax=Anaerosolibacter carboniphilus TaxID=1417629 RepID=A0A841KZI3_9FIRM|nr:hypothetical protein [Anaerosolibacter carboniphilus]MBB6217380.1 fluoroquinolone transport system permease protein [Anaerosolibacter carboniphilus]